MFTPESSNELTRRDFIKNSAMTIAAASTLTACSQSEKQKTAQVVGEMPKRTLGKTGLDVSLLAFGGGSFFLKNKDGAWEPILERAVELGINLFDTSSSYTFGASMSSEERFGLILPKYRKDILISTKFEPRDPDKAMKEIETSLERMKTDYVDFLMIHSLEPSDDIASLESGVYKMMQGLKEQGVARFIGFSSMDSAERSKEFIEKLDPDVCIMAINPTQYGRFADIALPSARSQNVGTLAMKVMRDVVGKSATPRELMQYSISQPGVATALVSHYGMDVLEENVALVKELAGMEPVGADNTQLEKRLAHLAGPHALSWARPDYYDGKMC